MHTSTDTARRIPAGLTGPRARALKTIDEPFANELLEMGALCMTALDELNRRENVFRMVFPELAAEADVATLVRSISVSVCSLTFLLNRVVGQRIAGRHSGAVGESGVFKSPWPPILGPTDDEPYWARLFALRRLTYGQSFRASRKIAQIIGRTVDAGIALSGSWIDPRNVTVLFGKLPMWAASLVNMPTVEQGGPVPDYTFEAKLQDLEWIKKGCYSAGWMSGTLVDGVEWIKDTIAKTEMAQSSHWLTQTPAAPLSTAPTLGHSPAYAAMYTSPPNVGQFPDVSQPYNSIQSFYDTASWLTPNTQVPSVPQSNVSAAASPASAGSSAASPSSDASSGGSSTQRAFSEAEVRSLLEQVGAGDAPPMPAGVAPPPLGADSGLPPDLWQSLAGAAPQATTMLSPKGLPIDAMGDVDWNDLLGMGAFGAAPGEGDWTMLGQEGGAGEAVGQPGAGDPFFHLQA